MNIISYLLSPINLLNPIRYITPYITSRYEFIKKPNLDKFNINNMKLLLLDMDGVLRIGNKPINIAKQTFNTLKKEINNNNNDTTEICIITNECRKTAKCIKKELTNMGFNMFNVKLIAASTIIKNYIEELIILNKNKITNERPLKFSLVVEETIYFYIKDNLNNKYKNIEFIWLFDKIKCLENLKKQQNNNNNNIDYFIIGSLDNNNPDKLFNIRNKLLDQVKLNKNAKFIITCPDVVDVENFKTLTTLLPNYILSIINKSLYLNIKAYCPSKPEGKYIKKEIRALCNVNIENDKKNDGIIIIGDNIDTDIKFGNDLKIQTGLVLTGTTNVNNLNYTNTLGIDYIVPDLSFFLY